MTRALPSWTLAVAACVSAVLLGALAGALGSFLQATTVLGLPVGLLVAVGLSAAAVVGSGLATGGRVGAGLAVAAWLVVVVLAGIPRPEGDVVLPDRWLSLLWLYGGSLVLAALVVLPYRELAARWAAGGRR